VVAAARSLPMGTRVTAADVKLVAWPERAPVAGSFARVESVLERGVIAALQENEPLTETKLAPTEAGAGLSPAIPEGMRAISVRVNEVIGVAGFVTPGTRVDVFATLQQAPNSFTRVVVSNVQVLTAGTRYDQDKTKEGEAMPSSVVTLLLTPADAERVVLASSEGQIMLALRNPLDVALSSTVGTSTAALFGEAPKPVVVPPPAAPARPRAAPPAIVAPIVPPPPPAYIVETIRAAKRGEETIR
jgi:pilus assembly protein CpaB